jgi:hypothetical protein
VKESSISMPESRGKNLILIKKPFVSVLYSVENLNLMIMENI